MTVVGFSVIDESEAATPPLVTVRLADLVALPTKAVMLTTVFFVTAKVVTLKLAEVCPAGILTTGGTWATDGLFVDRVAKMPPVGAGEAKVTVPVALVPPGTLVGVTVTDWSRGGAFGSGATLTKKDLVTPPATALTWTATVEVTGLVVTVKQLAMLQAGILTVDGT